jgi:hypothetical protein
MLAKIKGELKNSEKLRAVKVDSKEFEKLSNRVFNQKMDTEIKTIRSKTPNMKASSKIENCCKT